MPITNDKGENVEVSDFDKEVGNTVEHQEIETPEEPTEPDNEVDKHMSAETPEAKRARLKRQLEQHDKKYGYKEVEKPTSKAKKSEDFDYGQKAFLIANGLGKGEFDLVKEIMSDTGKSIEDVLESKYFKAELKERRDAVTVREATPTSKRPSSSPASSVDFWINKGELPPADQIALRREVVNEKIKRANAKRNPFG